MNQTFSLKSILGSIDFDLLKEFFSRHAPSIQIDWNGKKSELHEIVHQAFLALPKAEREICDSVLDEIFTVSQKKKNGEMIRQKLKTANVTPVFPNPKTRLTVQNLATWTYLNQAEIWERIVPTAYLDRIPGRSWEAYDLLSVTPTSPETERVAAFEQALTAYIYHEVGHGEYVQTEHYMEEDDEQFIVHINGFPNQEMQCSEVGEFAVGLDRSTEDIGIVYHPARKRLELKTEFNKKNRTKIAELFAKHIVETTLVKKTKTPYQIEHLKSNATRLTADADGNIVEAHVASIGLFLDGGIGETVTYACENGNIYDNMVSRLQLRNIPEASRKVISIEIHVTLLHERFKRSDTQIIRLTETTCTINSKNPLVRRILKECLTRWRIAE